MFQDHGAEAQTLQYGGADIGPHHHLDHRGAHHAHDIAEIVEHHDRDRQDELLPDRPSCPGVERRCAGQPGQPDDKNGGQEHAGGKFRYRGGDDAGDRNTSVEHRAFAHAGGDAEDDGKRHDHGKGGAGEQQGIAETIPDDGVDFGLVERRIAEIAGQRIAQPFAIADDDGTVESHLLCQDINLVLGRERSKDLSGDLTRGEFERGKNQRRNHQHREGKQSYTLGQKCQHVPSAIPEPSTRHRVPIFAGMQLLPPTKA